MIRLTPILMLAIAFGFVAAAPAHANLLTNPSFETGPPIPIPPEFAEQPLGSTFITGWTVTRDEIDYIGTNFWEHSDGVRSLDLDGTSGIGGIDQTFNTEPGTVYLVTFDMAASPGGNVLIKQLQVNAAGQSQQFSFDSTGRTRQDMGWEQRTWTFTANDTSTTLDFFSLSDPLTATGFHGPALDNVSVTVLPEPTTAATLACLAAIALTRRRTRPV